MQDGILRPLVELFFTFYPVPGTLQFFDLIAALLNGLMEALGLNIKFVGL